MSNGNAKYLHYYKTQTDWLPVATTTTSVAIDPSRAYHFAGVEFIREVYVEEVDSYSRIPTHPTTGTATIEILTTVQPSFYQAPLNNVLDITDVAQCNWVSNTERVSAELENITGSATHWRLIVASNVA